MKRLISIFLATFALMGSMHAAELRLTTIKNQTVHKIEWEKLPLPGMLGKMRPIVIDRFDTVQPNMPLIPPTTLSFKNPNKPSQAILLELKLVRRTHKGGPHFREDPKKYEFIELYITLNDTEGNVLQRWSQRINPTFVYTLNVTLKGLNLHKTDVLIMGNEIPMAAG